MIIKNKKKKGFTLIEMVAVVAIIGILAAILVPKITGYMKEAKKTGVIDQARKVTQAYETAEMKDNLKNGEGASSNTNTTITVTTVKNPTMRSLLDVKNDTELGRVVDKLNGCKISECFDIVAGGEFTVDANGVYQKDVKPVSK